MTRQDKEVLDIVKTIETIGIFPRYGIKRVIGGNEQDSFWQRIELTPGNGLCREQGLIDRFAIRYRVIEWLRRPFLARDECKHIKGVGGLTITGDENLGFALACEGEFHTGYFLPPYHEIHVSFFCSRQRYTSSTWLLGEIHVKSSIFQSGNE